ncbi:Polyribonucleotide 5'-hydroxyl-kinase Clp1 [Echinococcus granulosus]|uniref:Polyribonucleotide 5' hydroxyl kinase Clp1 n=1 Tax=Echinococcus granulosus TaxID=6210 RepID=A0A068WVG1_ECHGR|nr:Polyribonucleotide 5'-hydroxyl-kinase Clp1 [Echinococcus granulosus]CDS21689.1 polyribonucleotide 5' hydroxyl kinase Clp1 [Echinococcus granulosus]
MNTAGVGSTTPTTEYALEKYQMLRYEANAQVKIVMTSGTAEIFGTELVCGTDLVLEAGERGTVVTFHGCKITVKGSGLDAFVMDAVEDHDLLQVYVNIHANLQEARKKATEDQSRGPRVLVCGPENVGKSVLCRTLANYAARRGSKPILVDVNVGLNQARGNFHFMTFCRFVFPPPLRLWQSLSPMIYWRDGVNQLADLVNIRSENDAKVFSSGCIIKMGGFSKTPEKKQAGLDAIRTTAAAFEVDTVLVIEDGFLSTFLQEDLPKDVTIIRLPRSSGAVNFTPKQSMRQRDLRISAYFHGENLKRRLHPHHLRLSASEYTVYRVGSEAIPDALLPHGARDAEEETQSWRTPIALTVSRDALKNRMLAVSQATDPEQIASSPVFGFVVVLSVAEDRTHFNVLSPSPELPPSCLLVASICYVDPEGA